MVPIPVYIDIYRMNGGIIMRDNAMIVMFVKQEHQCKEGFDMDRTILLLLLLLLYLCQS